MAGSLAGRTAVITGASSGIGRSTALALARRGVRIALVARSEERLHEAAALARAEPAARRGPAAAPPLVIPADVADPASVERMTGRVLAELGAVDILINNAGIAHWSAFSQLAPELERDIVEVNVFGALHCTRAFLPGMLERGSGTIAFVSSGLGAIPFPGASVYCASKFALNGFADALRAEVEPLGVRVLLAMPGVTRTGLSEELPPAVLGRYLFQPIKSADFVGERIARALERGRRREYFRLFNSLGLRFAAAFPGFRDFYLRLVGRHLGRAYRWAARPPATAARDRQ